MIGFGHVEKGGTHQMARSCTYRFLTRIPLLFSIRKLLLRIDKIWKGPLVTKKPLPNFIYGLLTHKYHVVELLNCFKYPLNDEVISLPHTEGETTRRLKSDGSKVASESFDEFTIRAFIGR